MGGLRVGQEVTKGLDAKRLEVGFKTIPAGTYQLGSNNGYDANPPRSVEIKAEDTFAIAATEMTNAQWKAGVNQLGVQNTLLVHCTEDGRVTILARGTAAEIEAFKAQPISTNTGREDLRTSFGGIDVTALGALRTINLGGLLDDSVQTVTLNPTPSSPYNSGKRKFDRDAQPVIGVSWFEASAFAALYGWSLPSKTQWEVAAGDLRDPKYQEVDELERVAHSSFKTRQRTTANVKSKQASDHGLYDMLGNVWEWLSNPFNEGEVNDKETRGGSWDNLHPRFVSALYRDGDHPDGRLEYLGLRVAFAVPPQGSPKVR